MGKQVFLELTTEENIKRLNIDPRLVDSFKRVMNKVQQYFDMHGYSDKIDFESIVNNHLLPQQVVDRETIRQSADYVHALNEAKRTHKDLEKIVAAELPPLDEKDFLDEYIKKNYKIGLTIGVHTKKQIVDARAEYIEKTNSVIFIKDPKEFSPEELDEVLCHEFIHCLTMCGKAELGSIVDEMEISIYEPLTEMLATEIVGKDFPESYFDYCQLMQYINKLAGVNDYSSFLARKLDEKYKDFSFVFEEIQNAFDRGSFSKERRYGDMLPEDKKNLFGVATTELINRDYRDINDLIDSSINVYSLRGIFPQDTIENIQETIVQSYLSINNISNEQIKSRVMQLLKVKNSRRLLGDKKCSPINIEGKEYLIDDQGNVYYFDTAIVNKLSDHILPHAVIDGILHIFTESESYKYDLSIIDFQALGNNLSVQQSMLEVEIKRLMKGVNLNRPYINSDTVSTVIARDTSAKSEVLEPIQSKPKLRRPHIKKETMSMLQGKIKKYELDTKKKQLLVQKEMIQQMVANQQGMINVIVEDEEEQDMGMSL